jgi:predicted Zn-dependent protease
LLAGGGANAAWAAEPSNNPAVAALVRQGDFWSQKGRKDLATDAYRRALAAEPSNAAARRGLDALSRPTAETGGAQSGNLAQARALARRGEAGAAAAAYRQAFGGATPPDAVALEYYQTLAGAPGGQAQAQAGLRALAARRPGDANVQLALGQVLTYREGRPPRGLSPAVQAGRRRRPTADRAAVAWRQALVWMDDAPRNAALFNDYLAHHPGDAEIARKLADANRPLPVAAAPAVDPNARSRADGFAALERNDLAAAEASFHTALARRPNDADALGGMGLARLRGQRFAEATDLLDRAGRAAPASAGRWKEALTSARFYGGLQQAQTALDQGRAAEAERLLKPLTGPAYPEHAMAQGLLAESLRRQGKAAEAEAVYRQILAAQPGQVEAQQGLVQVLLDQNRGAEAEAMAARSTAFEPDASGQSVARGRLDHDRANRLWAAGDLSGANTAFESALAAAPADPWIRLDFARFLAGQGETASAQGLIAPVAAGTAPDQIQAAALFADQQGRPADALTLINRLPATQATPAVAALRTRLEVDAAIDQARRGGNTAHLRSVAARPDLSTEARGRVAVALYDLGDQQTALGLAQQTLISGVTEAPASYDGAVTVLARAGHDAEAAALIRQAAARAGATPQGIEGVANLTASLGAERADRLRQAGDLASAFDVLSAAFAVAPRSTRLLPPLGRLYQDGHLYDQAVQAFAALLRAKPGDQEGLTGLAGALAAKGDVAGARRTLAQALAAAPNDAELYLLSARIERQAGDEAAALRALRKARDLRQQTTAGGGLDAVLAPGAAGGGAGLGPNPFSRDRSGPLPVAASRLDLISSNASGFTPASTPMAPVASLYDTPRISPTPGGVTPYAGEAFPLTGRDGRSAVSAAAPVSRPAAPALAGNPFAPPQGGDPVADDIDRQIAELTAKTAAEVTGSAKVRTRSGEAGLSKLDELSAQAAIAVSAGGARFTASISPVTIDAGTPGGDAEQRFGANQIVNARAIVGAYAPAYPTPGTQSASGAALGLAVKAGDFAADVGSTPIGFDTVKAAGGASWSPRLGRSGQGKLWVERRPVTDSVIAYAGTRDPVTGQRYGQVMRSGGGASLSYDDGDSGLYGDASYYSYEGRHVRDNTSYQANLGGYFRPYRRGETQVQVGFNLNQQGYDNNQNFFSLGQGGYFSPKSFTSLTAPVSVSAHLGAWRLRGELAPGYQTYSQAGAAYFPLDVALQAELNALAAADTDVFARYRPQSASGFGAAGSLSGDYLFRPGTLLGGVLNFNTFGDYNETSISISVRQTLGEGTAP